MGKLNPNWRARLWAAGLAGCLSAGLLFFLAAKRATTEDTAVGVVKEFIRATYARDFARAYRLISDEDKLTISETDYVRERGAYEGFALRLAKSLAADMEFRVLEDTRGGERARIKAGFKLPSPEDLAPLVENWNAEKLNSLAPAQQEQILERVEKLRRDKKLLMVESQETFDLIKDGKNWHLFFDWAGGIKVRFAFIAPPSSGIEVEFQEKEIIAKPREAFVVHFKLKHRGSRAVSARIVHRVEPSPVGENLQMVQCGLLSPINLAPGSEQEMASVYFFDGNLSEVKNVLIAYEFKLEPAATPKGAHASRAASTNQM